MSISGTPTPSTGPTNNQQSTTGADEQARGNADQKDADDFSKALVNDKAKGAKESKQDKLPEDARLPTDKKDTLREGKQPDAKKTDSESPEDLFRSVYGDREQEQGAQAVHAKGADVSAAKTAEVQGANTQDAIDKIEKIVERIQVQTAGDVKTVNIKLNNSILPGTEVIFRREGGDIKVEFMTTSADSFNFLSKGEQALNDTLNRKFGDNVSVNIQLQNDSDSDQSGDGRSRNQYAGDESQDDDAEDNG
ncbi:type III secretion HpaP family protein [Kistimonas asteriae]|uniref:type III secretion HpaP family protein n=1 Tax=Kistimonas asteriae TaxID=517724 RepID=UPI001BAD5970|nr:type III secretion HpaP family protein [Kistimonas asteriae]